MVHILGDGQSVVNKFMRELRDEEIQSDPLRFRYNLRRVGWVLAYEIGRELGYRRCGVTTPLGELEMNVPVEEDLVVGTILRAGMPVFEGVMDVFDRAGAAFLSAYRNYHSDNSFVIEMEHVSGPSLEGKTLILTDAMLATGASLVLGYESLCRLKGRPRHTHIATVISSQEGVDYVCERLGSVDVTLWTVAVDEEMTAKAYIVPGLGDAGDLAYGPK